MHRPLYMIRITFLSLTFVFFNSYSTLQYTIYSYFSFLNLTYLILTKPFKDPFLGKISLFNEVSVLVACLFSISLVRDFSFKSEAIHVSCKSFIILYISVIAVNLLMILNFILVKVLRKKTSLLKKRKEQSRRPVSPVIRPHSDMLTSVFKEPTKLQLVARRSH